MKIICAPDSFKESISAAAAAEAMARGIRQVAPDAVIDLCPVADGGEGTVDALVAATGGAYRTTTVTGPLGQAIEAQWGMLGSAGGSPPTAVIEMAAASGLALVAPERRDPTATSTFGTGELIAAALDAAARRIIVGIGGSGTNDGGCGMAQALGVAFHDDRGEPITDECVSGAMLGRLTRIDMSTLDPRVADTQINVACDVANPLTGKSGAAHVYAPQKGATAAQVEQLDRGLHHLAELIRQQLGRDIELMPSAGAAGGLGGGLVAFLGATLRRGIEVVLEAVDFEQRVRGCDLCLTGEGRLDEQTLSGKACIGVARAARQHGVKTIALVGSVGPGAEHTLEAGLSAYHCIGDGLSRPESMQRAAALIEQTTVRILQDRLR